MKQGIDPEVPVSHRINVELLRKTLEWAYEQWQRKQRDEISEWEQGDWMVPTIDRLPYYIDESTLQHGIEEGELCGTSCCIAGKVAYDLGYRPIPGKGSIVTNPTTGDQELVSEIGRISLGLTTEEADALFSGDNSIYDLFALAYDWTNGAIDIPADVVQHYVDERRSWS